MDYDVVITNGTLFSADGETNADAAIRGETIATDDPDVNRHVPKLKKMVGMGCPAFMEFMIAGSEGGHAGDRGTYNPLERWRALGGMLLVHAAPSGVLDELIARYHTPELMQQHGA